MKEKEILRETVKEDKKRYYKPKKKKDIIEKPTSEVEEFVMRASEIPHIKVTKQVGSYKIGKSFHVFFEKKPNPVHRFFTKLFLGWKWVDNK